MFRFLQLLSLIVCMSRICIQPFSILLIPETQAFTIRNINPKIQLHQQTHTNNRVHYHERRCNDETQAIVVRRHSKSYNNNNDEDDNDEVGKMIGMDDAFRQLEALQSLGEDSIADVLPSRPSTGGIVKPSTLDSEVTFQLPNIVALPPEQEIKAYTDMVQEVERNEDAEAYLELMAGLGGATSDTTKLDTYSEVIRDLGGTPISLVPSLGKDDTSRDEDVARTTMMSTLTPQELLDAALQDAMNEVTIQNPSISKSILDDKILMKEIESILDEGNEKLMASLNEIRKEQVSLKSRCVEVFTTNYRFVFLFGNQIFFIFSNYDLIFLSKLHRVIDILLYRSYREQNRWNVTIKLKKYVLSS
jgi:hypothetical protein